MSITPSIKEKLEANLEPLALEIKNESDKHVGHAGHDGSGESHFHIEIVSSHFEGKNRIERQRMVYDILKSELNGQIHALSLKCLAPGENIH